MVQLEVMLPLEVEYTLLACVYVDEMLRLLHMHAKWTAWGAESIAGVHRKYVLEEWLLRQCSPV